MSYRNFVFTLNNPTDEEIAILRDVTTNLVNGRQWCVYIVFQSEIGGREMTRHLQGYMEMKKKIRVSTIKRRLGMTRIHLEKRRGSQEEAIEYSKKDATREEGDNAVFVEMGVKKRSRGRYPTSGIRS